MSVKSRNYAIGLAHSFEESEEVGMDDAHSAIGISLVHYAGDVDLARSCSWLACKAKPDTTAADEAGSSKM